MQILHTIFDDSEVGISAMSSLLRRLGDDHAKYNEFKDKNPNPIVSEALIAAFEEKYVNRIRMEMSQGKLLDNIRNTDFLFLLRKIDSQLAKEVCDLLLENDISFAKLIRFGMSHGHMITNRVVKTWGFRPKNIESYVDLAGAYQRVCRLFETDVHKTFENCELMDLAAFAYFMEHQAESKKDDNVIGEEIVRERLNQFSEVAPGAGASRDSFPEIQSATVATAAPGLHPLTAPALSNRPLYQSWGAEPILHSNFDTKLLCIFFCCFMQIQG